MNPAVNAQQFGVDLLLSPDENWQPRADAMIEMLTVDLRQRGLTPNEAPPLPTAGCEGEIRGPFRIVRMYDLFPITGIEDEPDDEGEPVYIYGPPAWRLRVDTIAVD